MLQYPAAERLDIVDRAHGQDVPDPYRWLEDADDPRTVAWSAAQEDLLSEQRGTWATRDGFHRRLAELHAVGSVSAPRWRGARSFTTRREPDQQHPVLLVTEADGAERVLIDPMALDPTGATTLDQWSPSLDGR